jgi:hypothetical protein
MDYREEGTNTISDVFKLFGPSVAVNGRAELAETSHVVGLMVVWERSGPSQDEVSQASWTPRSNHDKRGSRERLPGASYGATRLGYLAHLP